MPSPFLLQKWMWSLRMRTGSVFIHLWLSQNHKDIAKPSFSTECCASASERAVSALPKMYVKRQHGYLLSVQMQPKDAKRIPLWPRCWRPGVLCQLQQFSQYPIKTWDLASHETCLSEYTSLLTNARKATFSSARGGVRDWQLCELHHVHLLACLLGYEVSSPHTQDEERGSQQWVLGAV